MSTADWSLNRLEIRTGDGQAFLGKLTASLVPQSLYCHVAPMGTFLLSQKSLILQHSLYIASALTNLNDEEVRHTSRNSPVCPQQVAEARSARPAPRPRYSASIAMDVSR